MKKTVLAFSRLSPAMLDALAERYEVIAPSPDKGDLDAQFAEALPHAHGLIGVGRRLGREQLADAARLEVVSSVSVGYDSYDVGYLTERGIMLTNTPDVLTESTADLAFALILASARRVAELDAWTKAGNWRRTVEPALFGCDVHGKTLGIVGLGNIGAAIARRGRLGFGMRVLYSGNTPKPALERELDARFVPLDALLAESDFVCLVVPLSDKTRQLIGRRELALMKPSAILVNIARGPVVDEAALIEALQSGRLRGAGLDVYEKEPLAESPLFALPNAVTLPHIGSATRETRQAMAERAMENLQAALEGRRPRDLVNPQVWRG
ncbi:2-hydroxyacid dehydrogenase [Stutzerimonas urumqiensis]|uniref:2-hydroxyacid dehydrogenase n=1 Tax=Stutzerimonas urumqiensis TaxID=638269 RepID=UPI000EAE7D39|nr:D-glycerate dehydrogenase [Stutzerimonas urumqiensis]